MPLSRRDFGIGVGVLAGGLAFSADSRAGTVLPPLADVLKAGCAPGAGLALYDLEGVRALEVEGLRRVDRRERIEPNDIWHLGSDTKAMTAFLYAHLAARGAVKRGATLGELFAGEKMDVAWRSTTIEDVMAHRAGLTWGKGELAWISKRYDDKRDIRIQRAEAIRDLLAKPPAGPVGAYQYSNADYICVGAALERATGRTWEDLMRASVFDPLGMASAGFGAPPSGQPQGHSIGPTGKAVAEPGRDNPPAMGPAGTVHVSLPDYGRFLRLFLGSDRNLLPAEMQSYLTTPPGGGSYAGGWVLQRTPPLGDTPVLVHEGSNKLWDMFAVVLPEKGVAAAAATNVFDEKGSRLTLLNDAVAALQAAIKT